MRALRVAIVRLAGMFTGRQADDDLRAEMEAHLEMEIAENIRRGMVPAEARRRALLGSGGIDLAIDQVRDRRGLPWLESIAMDVRYGLRQLARAPMFTLVAILSITTGMTVAVTAFTLVNAAMLKPLPVPDAASIYHVYTSDSDGRARPWGANSYADYEAYARAGGFSALAASAFETAGVAVAGGERRNEWLGFVSPNFFSTLGLTLERGRAPGGGDAPEIVITWPFWQRTFGGDAGVLGTTIDINSIPVTIVGVAPAAFRGVGFAPPLIGWASAALMPLVTSDADVLEDRGARGFTVFGRLAEADATAAVAKLNALAAGFAEEYPKQWKDRHGEPRLVSMLPHRRGFSLPGEQGLVRLGLAAAILLVTFVVLLACTNVAALLLGRAVGRHHEVGVRLVLGASRARLMRQLLTESLMLAAIGGIVSFVVLSWTIRLAGRIPMTDVLDLRPDWRVVLAAALISLACALVFGLAPALQSLRVDLRSSLTGSTGSRQRNRLRGALIVFQVAASCVLILLACSAVRGVRTYVALDPGIELDGLVSMDIDTHMFGDDSVRQAAYMRDIRQLIATFPGVRFASSTTLLPLGSSTSGAEMQLPDGAIEVVEINTVGRAYFETVGVRPVLGRAFGPGDTRTAAPVAVVNPAFLERYGQHMLGSLVRVDERAGVQIVGVVPEIGYHDPRRSPQPLIYVVDEQIPWWSSHQRFLLRVATGSESAVANGLRKGIRQRFPDLVPPLVETLRQSTARQTMPHRIAGRAALAIGGIELALASVGLYGLLMFALFARTREIGVRLALGASTRAASWAVMRDGVRYAAYGAGVGLAIGVPVAIVAGKALPGADAADPLPFAAALGAVAVATFLAAYMPVRRAGRVHPATALRSD